MPDILAGRRGQVVIDGIVRAHNGPLCGCTRIRENRIFSAGFGSQYDFTL